MNFLIGMCFLRLDMIIQIVCENCPVFLLFLNLKRIIVPCWFNPSTANTLNSHPQITFRHYNKQTYLAFEYRQIKESL